MRLPSERRYIFTDVMIVKWASEIILGKKRFEILLNSIFTLLNNLNYQKGNLS